MYRGIEFAAGEADASEVRQHKVFALRVDLTDPTVEFYSTPSNGAGSLETYGQTTTTFVKTYGVAVGVNANFFSPVTTIANDPRELSGLAVARGDVVSPYESSRPSVLISRQNQVSFIQTAPASLTNVWTAVSGSNIILSNGVALLQSCSTSFCNENPRSAVGLSQDGRYFYLMVIDGRQTGWSDGATLYETGQWLQRLGAWNGLNLDGGGSTAMARLTNNTAVLINKPSGGVQRVNGNHIGVFAQSLLPVITAQPTNRAVVVGRSGTFSADVAGAPTLYYQWRFNGTNLAGATDATYTIASVQGPNAGSYSVVVSNAYGRATSSNAVLTVIPPDNIAAVGNNDFGQLDLPVDSTNVVAIVAGGSHSLALRGDGTVLAWGSDLDGEGSVPAELTNVVAVAAGGYHNLALSAAGPVIAWGANDYGQATVPAGLQDVCGLAAGTWHSLALQRNGRVIAWGDNSAGQISIPPGLSNVVRIAAGGDHSLALTGSGTVVAWGDNTDAAGNIAGESTVPPGLSNIVSIAAGAWHSLALDASGRVHAWGANNYGQATPPADLTDAVAIVAGAMHSAALCQDGRVVAWGSDWDGQCDLPTAAIGIVALAAGDYHTLALRPDAPLPIRLFQSQRQNGRFSVLLQTDMLGRYSLQQGNSLPLPGWTNFPAVNGNGSVLQLVDPSATNTASYYRVRRW